MNRELHVKKKKEAKCATLLYSEVKGDVEEGLWKGCNIAIYAIVMWQYIWNSILYVGLVSLSDSNYSDRDFAFRSTLRLSHMDQDRNR